MSNRKPHASSENKQISIDSDRRQFLRNSSAIATAAAATAAVPRSTTARQPAAANHRYGFDGPDSLCHGTDWESLNPGYWQISQNRLRRRISNVGDRARRTGFPFHYANNGKEMPTDYDPSQPTGIIYRRDWKLTGAFELSAEFVHLGGVETIPKDDNPTWKMYQPGYGRMGIALGAKSLFESYGKIRHAIQVVWSDDHQFQLVIPGKKGRQTKARADFRMSPGDKATIHVAVSPDEDGNVNLTASMSSENATATLTVQLNRRDVEGFVGVSGQGLLDFGIDAFEISPGKNQPLQVDPIECYSCYPLGDTLQEIDGQWHVRFVSLFATDGKQVEVRVATEENPSGGWQSVPIAGTAEIVNHRWRRNTASIDVTLPQNPAEHALYYTVWKDGQNVTEDTRVGSDSTGPGTGMVGDVPTTGSYVGRLPQLRAPYKACGLSCHAITSGLQQRVGDGWKLLGGGDDWQFRDQPTKEAYRHLDDYDFQIMVWEDDVWYMELVLYPPSTDDAYRVVTNSICGPGSRWQMMRHWNIINPGDHDYGMDDVKGPEQIAIRRVEGLGQDTEYMKRNFQIVHHLVTGEEHVDPLANPKKWRAWKMPDRDFTLVILDSRLWRSSQDTDIWTQAGWGEFKNLYDRTDPTRSLLGEEQFSWLEQLLASDSSPLICLTGINGMHTIWTGANYKGGAGDHIKGPFDQRDRVTADYAGWVKAGADRVLEMLGGRSGVVTVYGDVHNGCIMKNEEHRVVECSFGPIGRSGGRSVIPGFGPKMKDFDGRDVAVSSLYHKTHATPSLGKHGANEPYYWNFLEMEFDPRKSDPAIALRVRNLVDPPGEVPRGGGSLEIAASETGRENSCRLPELATLANADVHFMSANGQPLRAIRSRTDGSVPLVGLPGIEPGSKVIVTAFDGDRSESQVVITLPLA